MTSYSVVDVVLVRPCSCRVIYVFSCEPDSHTQAEQLSFHYPYWQGTLRHKLEVKYLMGMHICWLQLLGNYIINSFRRYELGLDKIEHNGEFKLGSCMCVFWIILICCFSPCIVSPQPGASEASLEEESTLYTRVNIIKQLSCHQYLLIRL